jgi:hypothetical protein
MNSDLHVVIIPQQDPRLGRHIVHDPRSRSFQYTTAHTTDLPKHDVRHRIFGPKITPTQQFGCCTGVDQAVKCDAAGNRRPGVVLGMDDAVKVYSLATQLDDTQDKQFPPDDTGTSGLAACKASQQLGLIDRYEWLFSGARQVLAAVVGGGGTPGRPVGVGTYWLDDMFTPDPESLLVKPTGPVAGGHQWTVTGWSAHHQALEGLCWWGPDFGDHGRFRITLDDLDALLEDDGDAHVTYRNLSPM